MDCRPRSASLRLIDAEPKVVQRGAEPVEATCGPHHFPPCSASPTLKQKRSCPTSRLTFGRGDVCPGGAHRRWQEPRGQADRPLLRVPGGRAADRRPGHPIAELARLPPAHRARAAGAVPLLRHGARQHPLRPRRRHRRRGRHCGHAHQQRRVAGRPARRPGHRRRRTRREPLDGAAATGGAGTRAAQGSPASSSSTRPPPASIPSPRRRSRKGWSTSCADGHRSSSPIASPP